jgi:bifunctional DNA-binding transcriptional regulator/antitoxin component of YhaV-PrlF toxin-antitoxin module
MITTVSGKNMISIPAEIARKYGIKPGWKLDWQPSEKEESLMVRVIPDRAEIARRLLGSGAEIGRGRDAVAELIAEREAET